MKITIEIPKEFERHFNKDKFEDSLKRLKADAGTFCMAGRREMELCDMLIEAFENAKPVKYGKWIKGKEWDEWFCSVCHKRAYLDCKENPILSIHCPYCGTRNCIGHKEVD